VLRYGNTRELCLGLEVVTAQGDIWHGLGGPAQRQHGLRLTQPADWLARAHLGIITAACMKLYPATRSPAHRMGGSPQHGSGGVTVELGPRSA
jgi:FAD/FMN-containing dehydrogenase